MKELVDRQQNDVRRAFIGVDGPYCVRKEYEKYVDRSFFNNDAGNRSWPDKVIIQPARYKEVKAYKTKPPCAVFPSSSKTLQPNPTVPMSSGHMESLCEEYLGDLYTKKDIKALTEKAKKLVTDDVIRKGFEPHSFFIKSSSKQTPHIVKDGSNGKFTCDDDCLGFATRKLCSHIIAVAFKQDSLAQLLSQFKHKKEVTLTTLTTRNVNRNAGLKRPRAVRKRGKSPDSIVGVETNVKTLGELFNNSNNSSDDEYTVRGSTTSPLKVTLKKKRPPKPQLAPTTTTPFQLIEITGRIRKCAGCGGNLMDGPDPYTKEDLDSKLCIRHKEHDFVWIDKSHQWKKTFDNKHFHVFSNCIATRNVSFAFFSVQLALNHTIY